MSDIHLQFAELSKYFASFHLRAFAFVADGAPVSDVRVELGGERLPSVLVAVTQHDNGAQEFQVQVLTQSAHGLPDCSVTVVAGSHSVTVPLAEIRTALESQQKQPIGQYFRLLTEDLPRHGRKRLLDVGGRARSGVRHSDGFPGFDCTVLDIVDQEGVDVVCDAHEMSRVLPPASFDVILCISVLEHILMPWKLAVEMNKVLAPGGLAYIQTHQTVGMHDLPWDFWRFSDQCWRGLFNSATGFEIVRAEMSLFSRIIPAVYADRYSNVESAGGFEASAVIVRKIGDARVTWDVRLPDVLDTHYPHTIHSP